MHVLKPAVFAWREVPQGSVNHIKLNSAEPWIFFEVKEGLHLGVHNAMGRGGGDITVTGYTDSQRSHRHSTE